jgi:hypothetical protein
MQRAHARKCAVGTMITCTGTPAAPMQAAWWGPALVTPAAMRVLQSVTYFHKRTFVRPRSSHALGTAQQHLLHWHGADTQRCNSIYNLTCAQTQAHRAASNIQAIPRRSLLSHIPCPAGLPAQQWHSWPLLIQSHVGDRPVLQETQGWQLSLWYKGPSTSSSQCRRALWNQDDAAAQEPPNRGDCYTVGAGTGLPAGAALSSRYKHNACA